MVLAFEKGIIRGAYIPEKWLKATADNFPGRPDRPGRLGFIGPPEIQSVYVGRRIPDDYRFGTANPIRYATHGNEESSNRVAEDPTPRLL